MWKVRLNFIVFIVPKNIARKIAFDDWRMKTNPKCLWFYRSCYMSESEGEEPAESQVILPQDIIGRGNVKSSQSAIKLTEVIFKNVFLIYWEKNKSSTLRRNLLSSKLICVDNSFCEHPSFSFSCSYFLFVFREVR